MGCTESVTSGSNTAFSPWVERIGPPVSVSSHRTDRYYGRRPQTPLCSDLAPCRTDVAILNVEARVLYERALGGVRSAVPALPLSGQEHSSSPRRPLVIVRCNEVIQRCRSRGRTAAAIDVIRFRLHRALRKIRHDFSRATPRSIGARAADSARLTVCCVGVRSRPDGRLRAVVTHGPAPM